MARAHPGAVAVTKKRKMVVEPPGTVHVEPPADLVPPPETPGPTVAIVSNTDGTVHVADVVERPTDVTAIHAAAEAAGFTAGIVAISEDAVRVSCSGGLNFTGATVAEVAEKIRTYNCKHCGTGGGHAPWCEKRQR